MDNEERLIQEIVNREWDFFYNTQNIGGQASCQNDRKTFEIMRKSQWQTCNKEILDSYLRDLKEAEKEKHNLVTEKYARMMEFTMPEEFEKIKEELPELKSEKKDIVEKLLGIHLKWREEMNAKYPKISNAGRNLKSSDDTEKDTSVETYLKGEFLSYSLNTLEQYYSYTVKCEEENINLVYENLNNMVKFYGYKSLDDAEEKV